MAECLANIEVNVKDIDVVIELVSILHPKGDETPIAAAKRCAAMAAKLPAAQKKARTWKFVGQHWLTLFREMRQSRDFWNRTAIDSNKLCKADLANLQNWRRKATRIAAALGARDGETLVAAAERVAGERKEWVKVKDYWDRQVEKVEAGPVYAEFVRRLTIADAEAAKWKAEYEIACTQRDNLAACKDNAVEEIHKIERDLANWKDRAESLAADFYRPILEALGISNALSFAGAREQVLAKFKEVGLCACTPHPEPPKTWD